MTAVRTHKSLQITKRSSIHIQHTGLFGQISHTQCIAQYVVHSFHINLKYFSTMTVHYSQPVILQCQDVTVHQAMQLP